MYIYTYIYIYMYIYIHNYIKIIIYLFTRGLARRSVWHPWAQRPGTESAGRATCRGCWVALTQAR